jgi:predicted acetyltransferase
MSCRLQLIVAGPEHQPVLANLLELYTHDFSEFVEIDVGEDGRFGWSQLALYWSDLDRRPFLARFDNRWAGFALVNRESEDSQIWDMAEFFVLRRFRRRGIGTELAEDVWRRCPGKWQIRVMENNVPARSFWRASIERFTGKEAKMVRFQAEKTIWNVFSLESPVDRDLAHSCGE